MKILVAYDGTLQSKEALRYGFEKARTEGGEVFALHLFNPGLFIGYDATPGAVGRARKESARCLEEAKALMTEEGDGIRTSLFTGEGDPEELIEFAEGKGIDILLCPPSFDSVVRKLRKRAERGRKQTLAEPIPDREGLKVEIVTIQ